MSNKRIELWSSGSVVRSRELLSNRHMFEKLTVQYIPVVDNTSSTSQNIKRVISFCVLIRVTHKKRKSNPVK